MAVERDKKKMFVTGNLPTYYKNYRELWALNHASPSF